MSIDVNKEDARRRFDSFYDWSRSTLDKEFKTAVWEHINLSEIEAVLRILDTYKSDTHYALDLGCGSGRFLLDLERRYKNVVGVDFSQGLLKKTKDGGIENTSLVQSDIEKLPFKDGSFDTVVCVRVIQHLKAPQQEAAIREMARVLKKGGRVILITYNAMTILCIYKAINMCGLNKIWPRWPLRDWKWVVDDYNFPWELKRIFTRSSLRTIQLNGAVCGEPEMFKFLKLSNFLERGAGKIFKAWLYICRIIDFKINRIWPLKFFLGRIVIEGEKI